jgi:hypothetical protein
MVHGLKSSSCARWNKQEFDIMGVSQVKDSFGPGTQIRIKNQDARESVPHFEMQLVDVGHNEVVSGSPAVSVPKVDIKVYAEFPLASSGSPLCQDPEGQLMSGRRDCAERSEGGLLAHRGPQLHGPCSLLDEYF